MLRRVAQKKNAVLVILAAALTVAIVLLALFGGDAHARNASPMPKTSTTFHYVESGVVDGDPFWEGGEKPRTGGLIIDDDDSFLRRFVADGSRRCQVFVAAPGYWIRKVRVTYTRTREGDDSLIVIKLTRRKARVCYYPSLWREGLWKEITLKWEKSQR